MTLLPMSKVSFGLSISRDSLCLVEVRRNWGGISCRQVNEHPLPSGLIRLSSARPNVENGKEFTECLSKLVKGIRTPEPIALCLPDLCARTGVFGFSSFPTKKSEQDALVSWRFQQDMNISTAQTRFAYQSYFTNLGKPIIADDSLQSVYVLGSTVQHTILEQYEQACLDCGLLPISVGLAGLDVIDFYQTHGKSTSAKRQLSPDDQSEFFSFYLSSWGFSFMAFRGGCPVFVRVKSLPLTRFRSNDSVQEHDEQSQSFSVSDSQQELAKETSSTEEHTYSSLETSSVANELVATLQYYFETIQGVRNDHLSIPLYFAEGICNGSHLLPTVETLENMLKSGMSYAPPIKIVKYSDLVTIKMNRLISSPQTQVSALPALASVMAA